MVNYGLFEVEIKASPDIIKAKFIPDSILTNNIRTLSFFFKKKKKKTEAFAAFKDYPTDSSFFPSTIKFSNSGLSNLHEYPILIAVSILSPVKTQIDIPASFKVAMVGPFCFFFFG